MDTWNHKSGAAWQRSHMATNPQAYICKYVIKYKFLVDSFFICSPIQISNPNFSETLIALTPSRTHTLSLSRHFLEGNIISATTRFNFFVCLGYLVQALFLLFRKP